MILIIIIIIIIIMIIIMIIIIVIVMRIFVTRKHQRMLKALTRLNVRKNKCSFILKYSFHEMCFQFALGDVNRLR